MSDVNAIAQEPHPIGSVAIVGVRTYLASRLLKIGMRTQLRNGIGISSDRRAPNFAVAGSVQNLVGELPGTDPSLPAVLLMAHYDTVPHSPGAADDTTGVAIALEVVRALRASGPHKRSVFVLFTDGEEPGLLGAAAFFAEDPLRERIGLVLNLEARGNGGRAAMFETSPNSGAMVRLYGQKVASPSADSLSTGLYRIMPNNSDFTAALGHGMSGMNFAFAANQVGYHTQLSTPENLDRGSVQHLGDQVLGIVHAVVDSAALPLAQPDGVYCDVLGFTLISYSAGFGWVIIAFAVLMLACFAGKLRARITWRQLARGIQSLMLLLAANVLLLQLCLRLIQWTTKTQSSEYGLLGNFNLLLAGCVVLALGASAVAIALLWQGSRWTLAAGAVAIGALCNLSGFDVVATGATVVTVLVATVNAGRTTQWAGLWLGMIVCGLAICIALQVVFPAGAYLVSWPVFIAALAALICSLAGFGRMQRPALLGVGVLGALMLGQLGAQAIGFFTAVGPAFPAVIAPFAALAALVPLPLIHQSLLTRGAAVVAGALGSAGLVLVLFAGQFPSTPALAEAFYIADVGSDRAFRASLLPNLDPWSRQTLSTEGGEPQRVSWQPMFDQVWRTTAPRADLHALQIHGSLAERLELRIGPGNGGRALRVWLKPSVDLHDAHIEGRPVPLRVAKGSWSEIGYYAPSQDGFAISFEAPARGEVEIRALETLDGWPKGLEPRAPAQDVMLWRHAASTMVIDRSKYSWDKTVPATR